MSRLSAARPSHWRKPHFPEQPLSTYLHILTVLGLAILSMAGGNAFAAPECSDTPMAGNHISCEEPSSSTNDINIDAAGIDIDVTGPYLGLPVAGVDARHAGSANININIAGTTTGMTTTRSMIDTVGQHNSGVYGQLHGDGAITITLQDTEISTQDAHGLWGDHRGAGDLTMDLRTGVTINTQGTRRSGAYAQHQNLDEVGNIILKTQGTSITTTGASGHGIFAARSTAPGDVRITVRDSTIMTGGNSASGILGYRALDGDGHINIDIEGGSTTTNGYSAHGILGWHQMGSTHDATGDITITTRNHAIETRGIAHHPHPSLPGTYAYGIFAYYQNSGNVIVDLGQGSSITTAGANSHGIVAGHFGTVDTRRMDLTVGGMINVSGAGARGVQVGAVSSDGVPGRMAAIGADGYRRQTVTVNGAITSAGEGVYLANGGKVILGPSGSIRSGSGIAILATGTVTDDQNTMDDETMPAIPPKLRVALHPEGQRMTGEDGWLASALGGGWILNDGGETTIAVNGVVLHEGATGVVTVVPNGVWDVTMRGNGVTVDDRITDPASWMTSPLPADVITDRDFSAADFTEEAGRCLDGKIGTRPMCMDPPPPMCPAGQTGTPPNCTVPAPPPSRMCPVGQVGTPPNCMEPEPELEPEPEPEPPMIMEAYAPRAALYEALPDFLAGLDIQDRPTRSLHTPDRGVWMTLSGSTGEQDFERSTVDTQYDTEHLVLTAGTTVLENRHWTLEAAVHHVSGSADVASPVRGGDLHAKGRGLSLDARWRNAGGAYARGRLAWTDYDLDLSSDNIGRLASEVDADRLALEGEAGHRRAWGERWYWTPHIRLAHTRVRIEGFTDAVQAQVAFSDTDRYRARVGVLADTTTRARGGEVRWSGALALERRLGGTATTARVSGERLRAEPRADRIHVSLGARWRRGPWTLDTTGSARKASGRNHAYSGALHISLQF